MLLNMIFILSKYSFKSEKKLILKFPDYDLFLKIYTKLMIDKYFSKQCFLFKNKLTFDVIDYFCIIKSKLSRIINTNFDNKSNIKFFAGYPLT